MEDYNFVVFQSPKLLAHLKEDTKPSWGRMSAQQMVEHLSLRFAYASKKVIPRPFMSSERMAFYKAKFFNRDIKIKKNFTAKGLIPDEQVSELRFKNLKEAIAVYKKSLREFDEFFRINPIALTYNPFFGYLSKEEWIYYHARHIKHHFLQFGLIDENGSSVSHRIQGF